MIARKCGIAFVSHMNRMEPIMLEKTLSEKSSHHSGTNVRRPRLFQVPRAGWAARRALRRYFERSAVCTGKSLTNLRRSESNAPTDQGLNSRAKALRNNWEETGAWSKCGCRELLGGNFYAQIEKEPRFLKPLGAMPKSDPSK